MKHLWIVLFFLGAGVACGQQVTPNLLLQIPRFGQTDWHVPMDYNLNRLDLIVLQQPSTTGIVYALGNTQSRAATQSDIKSLLGVASATTDGYLTSSDYAKFNATSTSALAPPASAGIIKYVSGNQTVTASTSDITALLAGSTLSVGSASANTVGLLNGSFSFSLAPSSSLASNISWKTPAADGNGVLTVNADQIATTAILPATYTATFQATDPTGTCGNAAALTIKNVSPFDISACISGSWQVIASAGLSNPMTAAGDLILGGANGVPTRFGIIPDGKVLGAVGGSWAAVDPGTIAQVAGAAVLPTVNFVAGTNLTFSRSDASGVSTITVNAITNNGTVTNTAGTLASGQFVIGNGGADVKTAPITGDLSCSGTDCTLNASGVTAGEYGDATHSAQITVDAKGRITSATAVAISGSGGGGARFYSQAFTCSSSPCSVSVAHNLGSLNIIPTVFNTSGQVIGYQDFTLTDANDASLTLQFSGASLSGTVRLMTSTNGVFAQSFTNATNVSLAHDLGTEQLFATVYNNSNVAIGYQDLTPVDNNNATLTFASATSGRIVILNP